MLLYIGYHSIPKSNTTQTRLGVAQSPEATGEEGSVSYRILRGGGSGGRVQGSLWEP